jgi:hypothetical protein
LLMVWSVALFADKKGICTSLPSFNTQFNWLTAQWSIKMQQLITQ